MGYIGAGPTRFNTADDLTVTGDAEFNGNLTVKGTTTTIDSVTVQNFDMGDNDKIRLGDSQDLIITHDGTDSIINDAGAGSLKFQYSGTDGVVFDSSGNLLVGTASYDGSFYNDTTGSGFVVRSDGKIDTKVAGTIANMNRIGSDGDILYFAKDGVGVGSIRSIAGPQIAIGGTTDGLAFYTGGNQIYPCNMSTGGNRDATIDLGYASSRFKDLYLSGTANVGNLQTISSGRIYSGTGGNASSPMIANVSDQNTGIYFPAADNMALSTGGTEAMRIDSSGRVGIGTTSPSVKLQAQTDSSTAYNPSTAAFNTILGLKNNTSGASNNALMAFTTESNGEWYIGGVQNSGNTAADFVFASRDSGARAERLRIDSNGNVGIGNTSPATKLDVSHNTNSEYVAAFQNTADNLKIKIGTISGLLNIQGAIVSSNAAYSISLNAEGGNVGIGITSPSELLHIRNASGDAAVRIQGNTRTFNIQQNNYGLRFVDVDAGSVERMRIDASGALLVNTNARTGTSNFVVSADTNVANPMSVVNTKTGVGGEYAILFYRAGSIVGSIQTSLSATSYLTSSDYRLKTAVEYDWDATTRLKQLKPARFEWIVDGDDAVPVDGFLAHEVQDIVPEAISGTKDGMMDEEYEVTPAVEATYDDNGNILTEAVPAVMGTRSVPDYQSIDQSKLVPLLVKTIQELEARIAALETA